MIYKSNLILRIIVFKDVNNPLYFEDMDVYLGNVLCFPLK